MQVESATSSISFILGQLLMAVAMAMAVSKHSRIPPWMKRHVQTRKGCSMRLAPSLSLTTHTKLPCSAHLPRRAAQKSPEKEPQSNDGCRSSPPQTNTYLDIPPLLYPSTHSIKPRNHKPRRRQRIDPVAQMRGQDDRRAHADQIRVETVGGHLVRRDGLKRLTVLGVAEEHGGLDSGSGGGGEQLGAQMDDLCALAVWGKTPKKNRGFRLSEFVFAL
jgi:hypothetical protein